MTSTAVPLYLDLLKRCVTNLIYQDPPVPYVGEDLEGVGPLNPFDLDRRIRGKDWPSQAHTMIGIRRLDNIQALVERVLEERIPGDLIETGVWRGGSTIFMRGLLKAYDVTDRVVWVADSFTGGLPVTEEHGMSSRSWASPGADAVRIGLIESTLPENVQEKLELVMRGTAYEEVRERFARYGLLDEQVQFLRGWFRDTLPPAPIDQLALLRLDGDFYDSTYDALDALYPKLSNGGYVIVNNYGTVAECRQAVRDYLGSVGKDPDTKPIDDEAVYWQKRT